MVGLILLALMAVLPQGGPTPHHQDDDQDHQDDDQDDDMHQDDDSDSEDEDVEEDGEVALRELTTIHNLTHDLSSWREFERHWPHYFSPTERSPNVEWSGLATLGEKCLYHRTADRERAYALIADIQELAEKAMYVATQRFCGREPPRLKTAEAFEGWRRGRGMWRVAFLYGALDRAHEVNDPNVRYSRWLPKKDDPYHLLHFFLSGCAWWVEQRILSLPPREDEEITEGHPLDWLHYMNEFWSDMCNAAGQESG